MDINILLADTILITHAAFIVFIILGQLLIVVGWQSGWIWPRNRVFRSAHLVAIGIVVLQAWFGVACPLTGLEHHLRVAGSETGYEISFVSDWLHRLFFYRAPLWVFTLAYSLFGCLVLLTWLVYPPRKTELKNR